LTREEEAAWSYETKNPQKNGRERSEKR